MLWYQRAVAFVYASFKCGMKLAGSHFNLDIAPNSTDPVGMTNCQWPMKTFSNHHPYMIREKFSFQGPRKGGKVKPCTRKFYKFKVCVESFHV